MPRQAHGRPLLPQRTSNARKRQPTRNQALNALEIAEKQDTTRTKIRQHRVGEVEDESSRPDNRQDGDDRSAKRRKVSDGGNDTDVVEDEGSDLEGGRWHEGMQEDDNDSDIDSDEAFGDSDEERFADFTFRGSEAGNKSKIQKRAPPQRKKTGGDDGWQDASAFNNATESTDGTDLGEDDSETDGDDRDDDEDDFGDEGVDLATALDMNEEEERREAARMRSKSKKRGNEQESVSSGSEETDSDVHSEDEHSDFSVSDDEQGDYQGLRNFVDKLNPQSLIDSRSNAAAPRPLPNKPSQYSLGASKLSAADLLQYVTDPVQRQSLKMLQANERSEPQSYRGGVPGKLAVPLAKRQQDKLDRAAAYAKSKETLNRWIETVKHNRRSEHVSFPLPDPAAASVANAKTMAPLAQSAHDTELEVAIQNIMQESGVPVRQDDSFEDQEQAFEELEQKSIPLEEVRARRAQLRMARDLMFREEIRARRIKKIKSKAYRRVHRKERDRKEAHERERLAAAGLINSDEEREKNERRRAEERMGARHRGSRWAANMKQSGRTIWDESVKSGISDLALRDEELRRRIDGHDAARSDDGDDDDDDDDSVPSFADSDTEQQDLRKQITALAAGPDSAPVSGLGSMAFMQRAEARRQVENDEELRQLRRATDIGSGVYSDSEDATSTSGRQDFGVRPATTKTASSQRQPKNEFEAPLSDEEVEVQQPSASLSQLNERANMDDSEKLGRKALTNATHARKDIAQSKPATAASHKTNPEQKQHTAGVVSHNGQTLDDYTSPSESEDEAHHSSPSGNTRDEIAAAIFAGHEDVMDNFAKEKQELEEEEGDQVIDNTLPGWGSWAGVGVSKREQRKGKGRFLTTIKGVAKEKRQDARLERVIINERRNKKNAKYLATELPHPFENRQQYERSLRLPMGPEWSTASHFQGAIKPRVLLKQGSVIRPIAKPTV